MLGLRSQSPVLKCSWKNTHAHNHFTPHSPSHANALLILLSLVLADTYSLARGFARSIRFYSQQTVLVTASSGRIGKEVVARLAKDDNFIVRAAAFTPSVLFFPLIVMPFDAFWCQLVHVGPPRNNSLICVLDTQSRIYLHAWTDLPAAPSSNASARSLK